MSLPADIYGRQVTVQTVGDQDVYTITRADNSTFQVSFPTGTSQLQVYSSLNAMDPTATTPPLLSQTMTPQQFGQYLILQAQQSSIARGLSPSQRLSFVTTLAPYVAMLNSGDLAGFVSVSGTIPIDGVIITSALVASFVGMVSNFLAGTI